VKTRETGVIPDLSIDHGSTSDVKAMGHCKQRGRIATSTSDRKCKTPLRAPSAGEDTLPISSHRMTSMRIE
jgi:hypothetical protein